MGYKKGLAARAVANAAASAANKTELDAVASDSLRIWNDGGSCVYYTASNGSEYKIDVATMEQTNVQKGTRRAVHRRQGHGNWSMWLFEAARHAKRNYTHSATVHIQYPKWVGFALDAQWRSLEAENGPNCTDRAKLEEWQRVLCGLDEKGFMSIFETHDLPDAQAPGQGFEQEQSDASRALNRIREKVATDLDLQNALFDRIACTKLSPLGRAHAIRWLLHHNFQASAEHCRTIALSCGSLTGLRVLLVEANVNVFGFELFEPGVSSSFKHLSSGSGGWIQHSKQAVKVLLGRGARLGDHGSRSKLLKRLENDGDELWAKRVLAAMATSAWAFPEPVAQLMERFLGVALQ